MPTISMATETPSILIIGSGVFGLSTALTLSHRSPSQRILVVDRSPFPTPDGSSIDASRIVRADYSDNAYSLLAIEAQTHWRGEHPNDYYNGKIGAEGRYNEIGLVLVTSEEEANKDYVEKSLKNVVSLLKSSGQDVNKVQALNGKEEIRKVVRTGGAPGTKGYVNWTSGWADAEESMKYVRSMCEKRENIEFLVGTVQELLEKDGKVAGVRLSDGRQLKADLTVLATGAWTPGLIDLAGRAVATGQVLGYVNITQSEEAALRDIPVILDLSSGMFVIPPRDGVLKVARHAVGYVNSVVKQDASGRTIEVSVPITATTYPGLWIPKDAEEGLMEGLKTMVPSMANRPFSKTRLCWYTDTPKGDFIVDYHPSKRGLFVATGGSGHAFKFLPVIGEHIADILEQKPSARFKERWAWPKTTVEEVITMDGSRSGVKQLPLGHMLISKPNL